MKKNWLPKAILILLLPLPLFFPFYFEFLSILKNLTVCFICLTYISHVIMRLASHQHIYHDSRYSGIDPATLMSLTAAQFLLMLWHIVDGHFVAKFMTDQVSTRSSSARLQEATLVRGFPHKGCHVNLESHLYQKETSEWELWCQQHYSCIFNTFFFWKYFHYKEGKYLISCTYSPQTIWKAFHKEREILRKTKRSLTQELCDAKKSTW